jgi:hypothetical protein
MVVIGTPNASPPTPCCTTPQSAPPTMPAVSALGQNVITAQVSTANAQPLLSRMRAITVSQGQCAVVSWQMQDKDGNPVDLTPCFPEVQIPENPTYAVVLRIKEQIMLGSNLAPKQVTATVTDASKGKIEVELTKDMVAYAGIFYAEAALVVVTPNQSANPCVVFSNIFSLIITRSTFGTAEVGGPPTIAEIRLHLRDSAPAESFLLDSLMFDDAEIALAITRPIQYWNEVPPPIGIFTTQNFPFRYHWLEGICANLFLMVAEQYRRNQLTYSAAGLAVDDQNKEGSYERAGQTRWQAYREWVRTKKAEINLEGGYGEIGSTYQYGTYSSGIRSRF